MLKIPEWGGLFEEGIRALHLPGGRRGISAEGALGSLLIEQKIDLLLWVLQHAKCRLSSRTGEQLDRMFGVDRLSCLGLDAVLTMREWTGLKDGLIFRLRREHKRYKHAQNVLYYSYRYLVEKVVSQFCFDVNNSADAIQEGSIALLRAIDKVGDEGRFLAYATSWIKRYVRNYLLAQKLPVYAPVNVVSDAVVSHAQRAQMTGESEEMNMDKRKALLLDYLRAPNISFDEVSRGEKGLSVAETICDNGVEAPIDKASRADVCGMIGRLMESLTEKQQEVLRMRFGFGEEGISRSLTEVAKVVGISHQQVSMREKRALQKLEVILSPMLFELDGR
jgi:RNA polymerase primary sigma factor